MALNDTDGKRRPWYLRKSSVYVLCLLLLPVGMLNILVHRNYWPREERREYIVIAAILCFFWILSFLSPQLSSLLLAAAIILLMLLGVTAFLK